jgi:putative transposase
MIAFIDAHRGDYGVEPICRVLPIAPSTYHDHAVKQRDPSRLPPRAQRDRALKPEILRVHAENFGVYGVRKVWRQMRREGFEIARCTVERLMRELGLQGVIRGKPVRTTVSDKAAPCPGEPFSSTRRRRTGCGSPISLMSRPGPALSTWPS